MVQLDGSAVDVCCESKRAIRLEGSEAGEREEKTDPWAVLDEHPGVVDAHVLAHLEAVRERRHRVVLKACNVKYRTNSARCIRASPCC